MLVSDAGLEFIIGFEGFVPYLYNDPANATVAIGILVHLGPFHQARGVCVLCDAWPRKTDPESMWLTEEQGRALLSEKIYGTGTFAGGQNFAGTVEQYSRPLNQNEFDSMVSFCFNLGTGGYIRSSVRTAVNAFGDVCLELSRYVYGVGVAFPLPGLVRRRAAECVLFKTPVTEDDELKRFNGKANFFHNKTLSAGKYLVNVDIDFPGVPAGARALRVEPVLAAGAGGLTIRDFNNLWAGPVLPPSRTEQIDVFIGPINEPPLNGARGFRMEVASAAVTLDDLGIVGYF